MDSFPSSPTFSRRHTNALFESGRSPGGQNVNPVWDSADPLLLPQTTAMAAAPHQLAAPAAVRPEESDFGHAVSQLVTGTRSAADTMLQFASIAADRAQQLHEEAAGQLHAGARYVRLQDAAKELELEASTWQLLYFLYGVPDRSFPGGLGGPAAAGCGDARTYQQKAADLLAQDDVLNRVARVVAWLEHLAAQRLDRAEAQGSSDRFGPNDGVWRETRARVGAASAAGMPGAGDLVTELDPDAPTRQHRALQRDNARDEQRIMQYIWRLVRAGKLDAARQLCVDCGQSWRAASLDGGGHGGPVPVGVAAEAVDASEAAAAVDAELSSEVVCGSGTHRTLWLWATYQAAEAAAGALERTGGGSGGGAHEAAVYAALCGHVARVLPVCGGWEDVAWAYFRAWLDLSVAMQLEAEQDQDQVAVDAVAGAVHGAHTHVIQEGMSAVLGAWPVARLRDAIPATLEDVFTQLATADGHNPYTDDTTPLDIATRYHIVQSHVILADEYCDALLTKHLQQWVAGVVGTEGGGAGPPRCSPALLRFAAHLGIALQALEVIPTPDTPPPTHTIGMDSPTPGAPEREGPHDPEGPLDPVHDAIHRLIQAASLRRLTLGVFLDGLSHTADVETCARVYALMDSTFRDWQSGDVEPQEESTIIVLRVAEESLQRATGGPRARAQSAVWLLLEDGLHRQAGLHVARLARAFALGGLPGVVAAWELFNIEAPEALHSADVVGGMSLTSADALLVEELRMWVEYFHIQRQLVEWRAYYAATVIDTETPPVGPDPPLTPILAAPHTWRPLSPEEQQGVVEATTPLLQSVVQMLQSAALDCVCACEEAGVGGEGTEVLVWAVPMLGGEDPAAADANHYNLLPLDTPDTQATGAALESSLNTALQSAIDAYNSTRIHSTSMNTASSTTRSTLTGTPVEGSVALVCDGDMGGTLRIAVACAEDRDVFPVVRLVAAVLKGVLGEGTPLQVVNVEAPPPAHAALLRCMLYPSLCLAAAEVRRALLLVGGDASLGQELVGLAADADGPRMFDCFAPTELQQLLELERMAV